MAENCLMRRKIMWHLIYGTELARAVPCRLVKNYVASYLCTELARAVHKCFFFYLYLVFGHLSMSV